VLYERDLLYILSDFVITIVVHQPAHLSLLPRYAKC
jgi:hypothetical protein